MTFDIYLRDLKESVQNEYVKLAGTDGNYEVVPIATVELPDEEEEYYEHNCPFGGDWADDCADCFYSGDYHYVDGDCLRRTE